MVARLSDDGPRYDLAFKLNLPTIPGTPRSTPFCPAQRVLAIVGALGTRFIIRIAERERPEMMTMIVLTTRGLPAVPAPKAKPVRPFYLALSFLPPAAGDVLPVPQITRGKEEP